MRPNEKILKKLLGFLSEEASRGNKKVLFNKIFRIIPKKEYIKTVDLIYSHGGRGNPILHFYDIKSDIKNPKENDWLEITSFGYQELNNLDRMEFEENQQKINESVKNAQWWNVIVMAVLVIATITIGQFQYNLSNKQTEILEKSSIPSDPQIDIRWINQDNNIYAYSYPLYSLYHDSWENARVFTLYISNKGLRSSGLLTITPNVEELKKSGLYVNLEPDKNVNLKYDEEVMFNFYLWCNNKTKCENEEGKRLVPGISYISLNIFCSHCEHQNFIETVPIC